MMDIFCEYIVRKKVDVVDVLKLMGIWALAIVLAAVLFVVGGAALGSGIGIGLAAVVFYLAYLWAKGAYVEFEYALTNNELDIDKIMGRSRRKRIITIDFKTVDLCACIDDDNYRSEYNNTASIKKTINATGISENDIYFVDFQDENGKTRVLFQPTDKMKDGMKKINQKTIHIL